jgi:hypothetical protein
MKFQKTIQNISLDTKLHNSKLPKLLDSLYLLTYSMQQSPSWEANQFCSSSRNSLPFWNPNVPHRTHKCPPPVPILSQLHPVPTTSSHFLKIHLNIILPSMSGSPQWSLSLCTPLPSPIRAPCPAHLILLDFTTRTILGKEYRSLSYSLCNFLHSTVTSSLLGPNTFLSTLFSNTLNLCSSLSVSDQVSHRILYTPTQVKWKTKPPVIYWY